MKEFENTKFVSLYKETGDPEHLNVCVRRQKFMGMDDKEKEAIFTISGVDMSIIKNMHEEEKLEEIADIVMKTHDALFGPIMQRYVWSKDGFFPS